MTKTIIHDKQILFLALVVAFFVGASITGVFFDYDAEAKKDKGIGTIEVGDELILKGKGTGTCTSGGDSGTAKANVRFLLTVTEVDGDNFSGVAKAQIKLQTKCDGAPKKLVNNGPVAHTYDGSSGSLIIAGDLVDELGNTYSLDVIGQVNEGKKTTIDMIVEIAGSTDLVIDVTGAGIKAIDSDS